MITEELVSEYTPVYTNGHPRSGQTWLGRLLSDVLGCPWQEEPGNAIAFYGERTDGRYVIRKRHVLRALPHPSVFIYRDPRDVCVSLHFYCCHESLRVTIERMHSGIGPGPDNYGRYEGFVRPLWEHPEKYTCRVRYEELHDSPLRTLKRLAADLAGDVAGELSDACIREAFERQKVDAFLSRYPQANHSVRKGIVGDWRNHFSRDDGRMFQEYFGRLMLEQGYVDDGDWWEELPA